MPYITPEKVYDIFKDCLFRPDELDCQGQPFNPDDLVQVEGILNKFHFNKQRLQAHAAEINDLVDHWSIKFDADFSISFLELCVDKSGDQWGEHSDIEMLLALSIGIRRLSYLMPREFWEMMPGDMPYILDNHPRRF